METRVLQTLRESGRPLSTNEVASKLGVDWHTADKYLDRLVEKQKVERMKWKPNLTLYKA